MTALPPEPYFSSPGDPGMTSPPAGFEASAFPPPAFPPPPPDTPTSYRRALGLARLLCAVAWAVITIIMAIGTVYTWSQGLRAASIMCLICGVGSGWYDFRVWTFRARRLWFPL